MKKLALPLVLSTILVSGCGLQVRDDGVSATATQFGANSTAQPNPSFTIGGTATGIPYKKEVKISTNGKVYTIDQNGSFTLPIDATPGSTYNLNITENPGGAYTCSLKNNSGTVQRNVTNIQLTCTCNNGSMGVGDGTIANPFLLYSAQQLVDLSTTADSTLLEKSYLQVCDMDYSGLTPTPIGDSTVPFTGQYNGGGFFILHYRSDENVSSRDQRKGIFGYALNGYLKNVNLSDVVIKADASTVYIGGLVATINDASILSSYAEKIDIDDAGVALTSIGGLVGNQIASTSGDCACCLANLNNIKIENITIDGLGSKNVGGIAGQTQGRGNEIEVIDSNIQSMNRGGGLVGYLTNNGIFQNLDIQNVSVEGNTKIGGIVGESLGSIQKAAFIGTVDGKTVAGNVGGIVGYSDALYSIVHSYAISDIFSVAGSSNVGPVYGNAATLRRVGYDSTATCQNCSANTGAVALSNTTSLMNGTDSTMSTWSFYDTWCLSENSYPRLMAVPYSACK